MDVEREILERIFNAFQNLQKIYVCFPVQRRRVCGVRVVVGGVWCGLYAPSAFEKLDLLERVRLLLFLTLLSLYLHA